jgi:hypothetical protein
MFFLKKQVHAKFQQTGLDKILTIFQEKFRFFQEFVKQTLKIINLKIQIGGSGAMWNMGQNETSLYFCMKQVLKLNIQILTKVLNRAS